MGRYSTESIRHMEGPYVIRRKVAQEEPDHECVICKKNFHDGKGFKIIDSKICNSCDDKGKTIDYLRSCGCDDAWIYQLTRHHIIYL